MGKLVHLDSSPPPSEWHVSEWKQYSGRFVNKRISRVIEAERQAGDILHSAQNELLDLNRELEILVQVASEIIIAFGAVSQWDGLKKWFEYRGMYAAILSAFKKIRDAVIRQNARGIEFVKADHPGFVGLVSLVDQFTRLIDDFQNDRCEGTALVKFIIDHAANGDARMLFMSVRDSINLGGRPTGMSQTHVWLAEEALRWKPQKGGQWWKVGQTIWDEIRAVPEENRSPEQQEAFKTLSSYIGKSSEDGIFYVRNKADMGKYMSNLVARYKKLSSKTGF